MNPQRLGPYDIERLLGEGGMGSVFLGTHRQNRQQAAVKTLSTALSQDEDFRLRFGGEIESLKKLRHPNIVQLLGWGEQDDVLFYAMEFVDGHSLQDRLAQGERMEWHETIQVGISICKALKHAHDNGIIHRDLKPANLLVDQAGTVKLTDFGIAKLFGYTQLTVEGGVVGTADYMAPEQALGQPATHRCDLYSLGTVLYTLLAGRPPFLAKSMPEVVHKVCYEPPRPVRRFNASVPPQLEALIGDLLEKDPAKRPPTARAVTTRLEAMQHGLTGAEQQLDASAPQDSTEFDYSEPGNTIAPGEPRVHSATTRFDATGDQPDGEALHQDASVAGSPSNARQTDAGSAARSAGDEDPHFTRAPLHDATEAQVAGERPARSSSHSGAASYPAEAVPPETRKEARFTTLEEAAQAASLAEHRERVSQRWMIAGLAVALVAIIGLVVWQTVVPPAADDLYGAIVRVVEDDDAELSAASGEIERFLSLYPNDSRAEEVAAWKEQIELKRLHGQFRRRGRHMSATASMTPLERAYLEAIEMARTRPEEAVARLQAILDVYGAQEDPRPPTGQILALAERHRALLQQRAAAANEEHLEELNERLEAARSLEATNPAQARSIYEGIILLYADRRWASEIVTQAEAALTRLATASE